VIAPYAFSPSSLVACASARKKNEVCGLIQRSVDFVGSGLLHGLGIFAVERLEPGQIDALDVAADAPFAEGERHPRLEVCDDPGFHLRMCVQVVVQAVGPGVHQLLQPVRARLVLGLDVFRIDEELHPQIAPDLRLAIGFSRPPLREQEVVFHPGEVVLGLRVDEAEDCIGVGLAMDVRNPPVVAGDDDVLRLRLPGGEFPGRRCL
jgi:hypothetical protein